MQKISIILILFFLLPGCATFRSPQYNSPLPYNKLTEVPQNIEQAFELSWPVDQVKITRGFILKPKHQGIDLDGRKGDKIFAAHSGVVIYTGRQFRGYGKMIIIEYNNEWASLYAHLSGYNVKTGDKIKRGDLIGRMGNTGRTTGTHLHFELIQNKQPVNPLDLLPDAQKLADIDQNK